jgi:hypothetical protein
MTAVDTWTEDVLLRAKAVSLRIGERTYTVIAMKNGKRTTLSTAQISPDGMTRIVRQTGTQVSGRDVNNTLVYERQQ